MRENSWESCHPTVPLPDSTHDARRRSPQPSAPCHHHPPWPEVAWESAISNERHKQKHRGQKCCPGVQSQTSHCVTNRRKKQCILVLHQVVDGAWNNTSNHRQTNNSSNNNNACHNLSNSRMQIIRSEHAHANTHTCTHKHAERQRDTDTDTYKHTHTLTLPLSLFLFYYVFETVASWRMSQ